MTTQLSANNLDLHLPYIFFKASRILIFEGAVSGCGVITLTTGHFEGSNPAAMTPRTTSLLVKIPDIVPRSITKTAVVRFSLISRAMSLTDVRGPTSTGGLPLRTVVKLGQAIFSRRIPIYRNICGGWFDHSFSTPSRAAYSFWEE